jgi:hypothetical protein
MNGDFGTSPLKKAFPRWPGQPIPHFVVWQTVRSAIRLTVSPVPQRDANPFKIRIRQIAEHLDINIVVAKYWRVSLQAYLRQPFRNLLHGRPGADSLATGGASPYQLGPRGYSRLRSSGMSGVGQQRPKLPWLLAAKSTTEQKEVCATSRRLMPGARDKAQFPRIERRRGNRRVDRPQARSLRQLVEQSLGLLQVERLEAFGEPAINRSEKIVSLLRFTLFAPPLNTRHEFPNRHWAGTCQKLPSANPSSAQAA